MPLFRKPILGRIREKPVRWLVITTGLILASLIFSACGGPGSILDTHGPVAASESSLFYIILVIATVIFVGVEGVLVWSIFRFRERPGLPNPRQIHGNIRVEVLWTVIPAIILFIVLFFTISDLIQVATQPVGTTVEVQAVGHQWWWEFYYPKYNITTADTLHAPVNTIVHVTLFSNNVIHSFWIPALTGKTDLIPGHNNDKWFKADQMGLYRGECAEYCGTQHANMEFNAQIESMDSFNTWVTTQQQAAAPASGSLATQGAKDFQGICTACHGIVGVNVQGYYDPMKDCFSTTAQSTDAERCKVGPNLTHFGSRNLIAGGVLTNNPEGCDPTQSFKQLLANCHLAQWLNDPQGIKPGNDMQISQLTPDQITQLVAYLESLK